MCNIYAKINQFLTINYEDFDTWFGMEMSTKP